MTFKTPTISALTLNGMPQFIEAEISNRALLNAYRNTGLPVGVMDIENAYIPEAALSAFISEAARAAGDDKIGLCMVPFLSVASYGTWGQYVLEAQTLGDSLARFEQVIGLHASYRTWRVTSEGPLVWIRYQFQVDRNADYQNLAYCGVGVLCNIIRHYVGPNWKPDALEIDILKPSRAVDIEDAFCAPVSFGCNAIGIAFQRSLLLSENPVPTAPASVSLADVVRSRSSAIPNSVVPAVAEVVRLQMRKGKVDMDAAARAFGIGVRRLRRAMEREGSSFREVTRRVRTDLAKELIVSTSLPLSEISEQVGYANPSLFTRAFTRDVGQSPSIYRTAGTHSFN